MANPSQQSTDLKVRRGPMQGGYSTNLSAMNKFMKNTHILAKLRAAMKKKLRALTSSVHQEKRCLENFSMN